MWLLRAISLPYLRRYRWRTVLTVSGIAAGVASIVATGAVSDSVLRSFTQITSTAARGAQLRIGSAGNGLLPSTLAEIEAAPGVRVAAGLVQGSVTLTPGERQISIYGLDLVEDSIWRDFEAQSDVEMPDRDGFVLAPDSVLIPRALAEAHGFGIGSRVEVISPAGPRPLTVRGLMSLHGEAAELGRDIAVLDLPAAQALLGKGERYDLVEIWLDEGASLERVRATLQEIVAGIATIEEPSSAADRAKHVLFAIRVFLTLAAFVAVVVGFFIVYHSVATSLYRRRRQLAVVHALGVARRTLRMWLLVEVTCLGLIAYVLGYGMGIILADVSLDTFEDVTASWIAHSAPSLTLSIGTAALALAIALITSWAATVLAMRLVFRQPTARTLAGAQSVESDAGAARRLPFAAAVCFVGVSVLLALAPRTLPYTALLAYVLVVNGLLFFGLGLLGPSLGGVLGRFVAARARHRAGVSWLIAGANLARNRGSFVVAITAIIMGLASTLATLSLTASLKESALTWLDHHYRTDLVVCAKGAFLRILTAPVFAADVVEEIGSLPGVRDVQAVRVVEVDVAGGPAVLLAYDRSMSGFHLFDAEWTDVAPAFWEGRVALVSDNLARLRGIERGDEITLNSPAGRQTLSIAGTFPDYTGGSQLGSIAVAREWYRATWRDDFVTRARIWTETGVTEDVRATIVTRFADTRHLEVLTFSDARREIADLIADAFSLMYGLVAVALVVSFVGIVNSLLTAIADRERELRVMLATGISRGQGMRAVVCEGTLVGAAGVLLGVAGGVVASAIIVRHSVPMVTGWMFEFHFPIGGGATIASGALLLAALAGIAPGWVATRQVSMRETAD